MIDYSLIEKTFSLLKKNNFKLITAESLTAGMISSEFSGFAGASAVLWGGFVLYDTKSKTELLHIDREIVDKYGVISKETAEAMAKNAADVLHESNPELKNIFSVAVTGNAGPTSLEGKPVGTVFIAVCTLIENKKVVNVQQYNFEGEREKVREETVNASFEAIYSLLEKL